MSAALYLDPRTVLPVRDFGTSIFDRMTAQAVMDDLTDKPVWSLDVIQEYLNGQPERVATADTVLDMTMDFPAIPETCEMPVIETGYDDTQVWPAIVIDGTDDNLQPALREAPRPPIVLYTESDITKMTIVHEHKKAKKKRFVRIKKMLGFLAEEIQSIKLPTIKFDKEAFVAWGYGKGYWG